MKALPTPRKQKGAVLILVTVALFTLLGFAALALDGGYLLLNKSRLQDAVDSAALSGAVTLNLKDKNENTHEKARGAVEDTLREILKGPGFEQVNINLDDLASVLDIEFSVNPVPFTPSPDVDARAIRVRLDTVPVEQFLSQLLVDIWQVRASAVAAASPSKKTQIIPLLLCAKSTAASEISSGDFGFSTTSWDGEGDTGDLVVIKKSSKGDNPVGPGNFLELDFKCYNNDPSSECIADPNGGGGSLYKHALSGKLFENSLVEIVDDAGFDDEKDNVVSLPGNRVGPTGSGLNTRFNIYEGDMKSYEPEAAVSQSLDSAYYPDCKLPPYMNGVGDGPVEFNEGDFLLGKGESGSVIMPVDNAEGSKYSQLQKYSDYYKAPDVVYDFCDNERRIVNVPVADCNNPVGNSNGKVELDLIGISCFFLNQEVTGSGNTQYVVAEKIQCDSDPNGANGSGVEKIVLYDDTDSGDS